MALPPALSQDATRNLPAADPHVPPSEVVPEGRPSKRRIRHMVKAALRPAVRRVARPLLRQLAAANEQLASQQHELLATQRRVDALELLGRASAEGYGARLNALTVNQELLKGDLLGVHGLLDGLAAGLGSAVGMEEAGARIAELRERVYGLERRLRTILSDAMRPPARSAPDDATPPAIGSELFDYDGFERRFRGDPAVVVATLEERYLEPLRGSPPVLDIGCGRGELVGLLTARGVESYGIDLDASLVAEGTSAGLDIRLGDAVEHLRSIDPGALGAIIGTHVVEHLELDQLLALIELSVSRLRPGGLFIVETPNPASLFVLGNTYVLDPTHVRPLHPLLLSFLCESAGFREIDVRFFAPVEGLPPVDGAEAPQLAAQVNAVIGRLNAVVFGPQDYAIIARTPPDRDVQTAVEG